MDCAALRVMRSSRRRRLLEPDATLSAAVSMSAQLTFYAVPPCRVADTRNPYGPREGLRSRLASSEPFQFFSLIVAYPTLQQRTRLISIVPQGFLGHLSIWPTGLNQPLASTLNSVAG
jgi:hypothetical protein